MNMEIKTCSNCGASGHNKRTCKIVKNAPAPAPASASSVSPKHREWTQVEPRNPAREPYRPPHYREALLTPTPPPPTTASPPPPTTAPPPLQGVSYIWTPEKLNTSLAFLMNQTTPHHKSYEWNLLYSLWLEAPQRFRLTNGGWDEDANPRLTLTYTDGRNTKHFRDIYYEIVDGKPIFRKVISMDLEKTPLNIAYWKQVASKNETS